MGRHLLKLPCHPVFNAWCPACMSLISMCESPRCYVLLDCYGCMQHIRCSTMSTHHPEHSVARCQIFTSKSQKRARSKRARTDGCCTLSFSVPGTFLSSRTLIPRHVRICTISQHITHARCELQDVLEDWMVTFQRWVRFMIL